VDLNVLGAHPGPGPAPLSDRLLLALPWRRSIAVELAVWLPGGRNLHDAEPVGQTTEGTDRQDNVVVVEIPL
jgi:hypothetical protein